MKLVGKRDADDPCVFLVTLSRSGFQKTEPIQGIQHIKKGGFQNPRVSGAKPRPGFTIRTMATSHINCDAPQN